MLEGLQRIKSFIYRAIFIIICFTLCKGCVNDYINGSDKNKISQYEKMISDDSFVIADLSEEYTETTVGKVAKMYTFKYSFDLEEKDYKGEITVYELPELPILKIFYLKSNPNIISVYPKKEIEKEKEKGTITDLIMGIVWGILLIFSLLSFFVSDNNEDI